MTPEREYMFKNRTISSEDCVTGDDYSMSLEELYRIFKRRFEEDKEYQLELEAKYPPNAWYNNIPEEGVLCEVWMTQKKKLVGVVTRYEKDTYYPFVTENDSAWKHAEPLTLETVGKYLYKGQEK
jgi:hypothetical protein